MRLGSPGCVSQLPHVHVRNASHRSPVACAAGDQRAYESADADLSNSGSSAARDGAPRYPALDLDAKTQHELSIQIEQPRLRVGAKDEDTEASCLCDSADAAAVPPPPPSKFNPVPIVATAASVPVLANWYTNNPATNPSREYQVDVTDSSKPADTLAVTAETAVTAASPVNEKVEVVVEPIETPKPSEEIASVSESPADVLADAPVADNIAEAVNSPPSGDDETSTAEVAQSDTAVEEPVLQSKETTEEPAVVEKPAAVEQPVIDPTLFLPDPEVSQLVHVSNAQAAASPSYTVSNILLTQPSPDVATLQQGVASIMQVSVTQGNEVQGPIGTDARYPAFTANSSLDAQYTSPPEIPNYMPRPGAQRSPNCDAALPAAIDQSTQPGNAQMNITSSAGEYSTSQSVQGQQVPQYQSRPQQQMQPYNVRPYELQQQGNPGMRPYDVYQQGGAPLLRQRQPVPEMGAPPANPMPLAPPYSGGGSYGTPHSPSPADIDPWGILEHQGAYGLPQGLLHIDGGGTYGAFSYGPPSQGQPYAAPPANTQEGYRAYGPAQQQSPGQQQYYSQQSQQPQMYSQRGGGQQVYQGAPPEGYFYPPQGAQPPPQARRRAPEQQYAPPPPPQGNSYSYQASPAGTMQDPYGFAGQYSGNQSYNGGNAPYGGSNQQPFNGGNATGNQGYGGNQSYAGNQGYGGNQSYAGNQGYSGSQGYAGNQGYNGNQGYSGSQGYTSAQYGNQPYSAPAQQESSQSSYPGIELLSPGYPEYEKGHKNASQKASAPPPEAYFPGIESTYSAYGMKAPTAPTSNPPSQSEYSYGQNPYGQNSYGQSGQTSGYSYYTSPSNYQGYQGQVAPGQPSGAPNGPVVGYGQPPSAPAESYQGYQGGYSGQAGSGYYGMEAAPVPRAYGQWPTADRAEKREAATLVLPADDMPDFTLPLTEISGPVTTDIQSVKHSMKTQLSLNKVHQQYIPMATLPPPTQMESLSALSYAPAPSIDVSLIGAAFCCMMAAKAMRGNTEV